MNEQLSEIAQRWADQMARSGKLEHSPAEMRNFGRQTLGENFESSFQSELTGLLASGDLESVLKHSLVDS